jgi:hypothetical protein
MSQKQIDHLAKIRTSWTPEMLKKRNIKATENRMNKILDLQERIQRANEILSANGLDTV